MSVSGSGNTIGGTQGTDGNTIGFAGTAGVSIGGAGGTGNSVIGNFIGTDAAGGSLGNLIGVSLTATGNTVGGTSATDANIIGFNFGAGISIIANGDFVLGNFIGTNSVGNPLGNAVGVSVSGSTNTIGEAGAANTIGFSTQQGVSVLSGSGNVISENCTMEPTAQHRRCRPTTSTLAREPTTTR